MDSIQKDVKIKRIFSYTNYRSFLMEHVNSKKQQSPYWSYKLWARQLNLKSSSTIIMIINGQRHPGPQLILKLCNYFKLDKKESEYLNDLIQLEKSRGDVKRSNVLLKQLELRTPGLGFHLLDQESFYSISQWHHYAIREMVQLKNFKEDFQWISRQLQFSVSPLQVKEAINSLLRLKLLTRDLKGRLISTSLHLDTTTDQCDEGLRSHHHQQLDNAKESLQLLSSEEREISGGCFTIRSKNLKRAKKMIRAFQIQMCNELEESKGDQVYQIEVAFFPLTKKVEVGSDA